MYSVYCGNTAVLYTKTPEECCTPDDCWMAKLIYSIKICLFEPQIQELPHGTITGQQTSTVREFVNFATLATLLQLLQFAVDDVQLRSRFAVE